MPRMNFRGVHALVLHRPDRDGRLLCEQLHRLGVVTQTYDSDTGKFPASAQVCFFDVESGDDRLFPWPRGSAPIPTIALIGSETRARLDWMLSHEPHACLTKPIQSSGVYSALVIADHVFARARRVAMEVADLRDRVRLRRVVFDALLRVMKTFRIDEVASYRMLRTASQQRRISIEQMSALVVGGDVSSVLGLGSEVLRKEMDSLLPPSVSRSGCDQTTSTNCNEHMECPCMSSQEYGDSSSSPGNAVVRAPASPAN